jgi:hypothetical protein
MVKHPESRMLHLCDAAETAALRNCIKLFGIPAIAGLRVSVVNRTVWP